MRKFMLFLFSHRFLAIGRWEFHFVKQRFWGFLTFQNARIGKFLSTREAPVYLNLGSGPRGLDDAHWVNIDGFADRNVHHLADITRRLPFPDACFAGVFCEHVMEHFPQEEGEALAREILRVLVPGGCFRIVVPDAERIMRLYFDAPDELVAMRGEEQATPMEVVNSYFRQRYEHQFLYDSATLTAMLKRAGFTDATREVFRSGKVSALFERDDVKYRPESLYMDALK
jgi:predicted SAM-dependent methyltransferase